MQARMKHPAFALPGAMQALTSLGKSVEQAGLPKASVDLVAPDAVPDEVWDEVAAHYSESELAALLMAVATVNVWNRLNAATRQIAGTPW